MSIVTLKKKSNTKYVPISGKGSQGFSLNGGYRNTHYIGQTSLSRPVNRTIFKGAIPVGNGGCCGTYTIDIISPKTCTNDIDIIKTSTKNTKGYFLSEFIHPICDEGCSQHNMNWVKDTPHLSHTHLQSIHIDKVKRKTTTCNDHIVSSSSETTCCDNTRIGSRVFSRTNYWKNSTSGALDSSQYTDHILYKKKCLPTPDCKTHFPMLLHKGGCNVEAKTPQEAIEKGLLPENWMNC